MLDFYLNHWDSILASYLFLAIIAIITAFCEDNKHDYRYPSNYSFSTTLKSFLGIVFSGILLIYPTYMLFCLFKLANIQSPPERTFAWYFYIIAIAVFIFGLAYNVIEIYKFTCKIIYRCINGKLNNFIGSIFNIFLYISLIKPLYSLYNYITNYDLAFKIWIKCNSGKFVMYNGNVYKILKSNNDYEVIGEECFTNKRIILFTITNNYKDHKENYKKFKNFKRNIKILHV